MIGTVYSHYTGFEKVVELIKETYPEGNLKIHTEEGTQEVELSLGEGLLKILYRERAVPSYQLPEADDSPLTANLKGLWGFVNALPTQNEKVKELFLHKIPTLNCEFSIIQEKGTLPNVEPLIRQIAEKFDAILFVQPGTPLSKSGSQHFLDKNLNLIIDGDGNCEIDTLDVKIESIYFDKPQTDVPNDSKERKAKNEETIKKQGAKVNPNLPYIESETETELRSPKEIAQRVCVLAMTNLVAFNALPGEDAVNYLKSYNMWQHVTPDEKDFLENPTEEKKNSETWKCEDIWVLMWALKKVEHLLPPNEMCDLNQIPAEDYPVAPGKDPNDFIHAVSETRSKAEILDANDLYYRLNWACVDARINNKPIEGANPGLVYERHYALNWLINYMGQEWDDVSCDT